MHDSPAKTDPQRPPAEAVGKFVIVRNNSIFGPYERYDGAIRAARLVFPDGRFVIMKLVAPEEGDRKE